MPSKLKLADNFTLPPDVNTQTVSILAKRRAGKSYFARKLAEQLIGTGSQVVVVDPKGDWWGIRSAADGKSPGLKVVILGGEHGDCPLEVGGGEIVAKLVVEERVSVLLDLSLFRKGEVATFMTAFQENLYRLKAREINRTPLMLIVDEADAIAPQKPQENETRMLGAIDDIVRRGGQRGIGCTLITQRSASINKNVLTQTQVLICLRTIAPQDLKAVKEWIDVHGTVEQGKQLIDSLPSLPIGDAWVWSPGWPTDEGIFQRVHVSPIETFDSGATPKAGEKRREPKNLADIDLAALTRQMKDTIERVKADDPKTLKARIKELETIRVALIRKHDVEKELRAKPVIDQASIDKAVAAAVKPYQQQVALLQGKLRRVRDLLSNVEKGEWVGSSTAPAAETKAAIAKVPEFAPRTQVLERNAEPKKPAKTPIQEMKGSKGLGGGWEKAMDAPIIASNAKRWRERTPRTADASSGDLPKGEAITLRALIQFENGLRREQLTVLTSYTRSSRNTYLQRLGTKGLVEQRGDLVVATDAGRAALPDAEPLPTGIELQQYWLSRLPAGEKAVLEVLLSQGGDLIERESIDEPTGYTRSSRNTYLQRLSAKELIVTQGGQVAASPNLF